MKSDHVWYVSCRNNKIYRNLYEFEFQVEHVIVKTGAGPYEMKTRNQPMTYYIIDTGNKSRVQMITREAMETIHVSFRYHAMSSDVNWWIQFFEYLI